MDRKILKTKISLFTCLLGLFNFIHAQNAAISGVVKDNETGSALEDVVITIKGINNHTHTDVEGKFVFNSLAGGKYDLDIDKLGYKKQSLNVELAEGEVKQLNIALVFNLHTLVTIDVETDKPVSAASSQYISQLDFQNRPKNSAQDMLRLVPGVFIAQHAGGGKAEQIFVRGFDCDHGTDVATFVDGMPVNMPSHGHGQGYADLHFLIPEVVKGMDVFKGPYSPQYGDFATGAAIQFNTMDTLTNNLVQLETGFVPDVKALTSKRGLLLLQLPDMGSKVSSYVAADVINNRGYFENDQHFNRASFFSKTVITLNEHSKLKFSAGGFGSSWDASGQVPERAVTMGIISRFGSIDNSEGGATQRTNLNLSYQTKLSSGDFETQVYSFSYRFKLFSDFTFFATDSVHGDEIEQDDSRLVHGINSRYSVNHKLGRMNNRFSAGVSFREDNIENALWHAQRRVRLNAIAQANIHERSSGVYLNEIFRFSNHFRAELGLRYDYFTFDVDDLLPTDTSHNNYSGYNYQLLLSPKLNLIYEVNNKMQFFINAGSGYHSNDARSVVQQSGVHQLPRAIGAEIGSLTHFGNNLVVSAAFWWMDLTNELVYTGDDGTTEDKGPSRRRGIDLSARLGLTSWLFIDADLNLSKNVLIDTVFGNQLKADYYIPLAPTATSAGGITVKTKSGFGASLRYRYMASRPANESGSVIAHGYNVFDMSVNYQLKHIKIGLVIENLFDTKWNEAQFDTESRLSFETQPVSELHFTPGTPFYSKLTVAYLF